MTPTEAIQRTDALFPKYWDNALSESEWEEWERILHESVEARRTLQTLSLQAAAVAEISAESTRPSPHGGRRRFLATAGVGLAAGVMATVGYWRSRPAASPSETVRVASVTGNVEPFHRPGGAVQVGDVLNAGQLIRTLGDQSSAVLQIAGRGSITLTGNTSVQITSGRSLRLDEGTLTADLGPGAEGGSSILLGTLAAVLSIRETAKFIVQRQGGVTEIGMQSGHAEVVATSTTTASPIRGGEHMTVLDDGRHTVQKLRSSPSEYAWDLNQPLPKGWSVGNREFFADRPCVQSIAWPDAFHNRRLMYEIRSHHDWIGGFFQLFPDSRIRLTYWVDRVPDAMQVVVVCRTGRSSTPTSGCLDLQKPFANSPTGRWVTVTARADEMLDSDCPVTFGPPWVGFQVIFNTYEQDCGLRVAEFRVSRPGFPNEG